MNKKQFLSNLLNSLIHCQPSFFSTMPILYQSGEWIKGLSKKHYYLSATWQNQNIAIVATTNSSFNDGFIIAALEFFRRGKFDLLYLISRKFDNSFHRFIATLNFKPQIFYLNNDFSIAHYEPLLVNYEPLYYHSPEEIQQNEFTTSTWKATIDLIKIIKEQIPQTQIYYKEKHLALEYLGLEFAQIPYSTKQIKIKLGTKKRHNVAEAKMNKFLKSLKDKRIYGTKSSVYGGMLNKWLASLFITQADLLFPHYSPLYAQIQIHPELDPIAILTINKKKHPIIVHFYTHKRISMLVETIRKWNYIEENLQDLLKYGYFPNLSYLKTPELWIVMPPRGKHKSLGIIPYFFTPKLTLKLITINSDWQKGLKTDTFVIEQWRNGKKSILF